MILDRTRFPFLTFDDPVPLPDGSSWTAVPTYWDLDRSGALHFTVTLRKPDGSVSVLRNCRISAPDGDALDWGDGERPLCRRRLHSSLRAGLARG